MRKYLLALLLLSVTICAWGQTVYTGRVVTEGGKGLGWASVVAEDQGHKPVAFTRTKEDGGFELKVPEGKSATYLTFSILSYAKKTIATADFSNGQKVRMREEALQLKEVKATSKRLRRQSDTLTYSVAGFRHKQDRSIADVIAKMPGLEVGKDGSISYQGKPINNFYIEGMDLMGSNYAMASENMSAAKVKDVQVLTNHQRVKALRGVQFSDQAALNLVLEEDAKNTWMGLLEAGVGTTLQESDADRLLRDGRLMAMMFGGRMQSLTMYKWNNTGKNIRNEIRDMGTTIASNDQTRHMTSGVSLGSPGLMQERYLMNDSRLMATNWLRKAGKDATLRLQLNGYLDETEGHRTTETVYSDALGGQVITEDDRGEQNSSEWRGELKYERNGRGIYLTNSLSGHIDFNKSWAQTLLNGETVRQEARPRKRWMADALSIVRALDKERVLRFNASGGFSYLPGTLLLTDSTAQHIDQHASWASLSAQFRHKLFGRLFINYKAGMDYTDQRFTLHRGYEKPQHDSYQRTDAYIQPSLSLTRGLLEWSASVPLRLVVRRFAADNSYRLVAEPSTRLKYQLNSSLTASASYSYSWEPASLEDITEVAVYTSYRNYSTGTGQLYAEGSHNGSLRIEYANPVIGLFGNVNGGWIYSQNSPIYNSVLDGVVYHSSPSGEYRDNSTWILSGRLSKSLGTMKFIGALNGQLTRSFSTAMMAGRQLPFRYDHARLGFILSLRPAQALSFEHESSYQYSCQVSTSDHSLDSRALRSFTHKLKTYYMPGKWQIEWTNEACHSNDHSVSFNYFSDLQVSYRTKKYEAGLFVGNIFGNHRYERQYISSYYSNFTVTRLRPREFLFKVSVDL